MKKLPLILSVGSVALLLVGCPASDQANQSPPITQETPPPSPSPPAAQPPAFSGAVQPATEPATPRIAGLIPATDPDQKRADINRGRSDPFAPFPLRPNITITEEEEPSTGTPAGTAPAAGGNRPAAAPAAGGNRATPRPPIVKAPPPPPQPTEAAAVQVLGIMRLPASPMAIVKAPGEATERRVTPGSTLSNGLILVKAIDTNPDNPYIVLEQYGQTVTRRLGDGVPEPAVAPQASISYNISESGE